MSFWKKDLIQVNGYNEEIVGWGREDSDITARLINSGKTKRNVKFAAIPYLQYHKESSRAMLDKNDQILQQSIQNKIIFCEQGLSNHCK